MLINKTGETTKMGENGADVEMDETYVGGKERNMHADKKPQIQNTTKRAVLRMIEKGGRLSFFMYWIKQTKSILTSLLSAKFMVVLL